jgi:tetratricopeptide (TPR) repeat protein
MKNEELRSLKLFFYVLTVLLSIIPGANAQEIDSLKKVIESADQDTTKINALNALGWTLMYSEPDTAIVLSMEALTYSEKQADLKFKANSLTNLGIYHTLIGEYEKALDYLFSSVKIRESLNDKRGLASCYNAIGIIFEEGSDFAQALDYHMLALKLNEELGNEKGMSSSYSNIAVIYKKQSDYAKALNYNFQSLAIDEKSGDVAGMASSYNNIGIIYEEQSDFPKALEYYFKALEKKVALSNLAGVANTYNNIGVVYHAQSEYLESLTMHFKSLRIREKLHKKEGTASSYSNIASVYMDLFQKSDSQRQRIGNWALTRPSLLLDSALYYAQKSIKIKRELSSEESLAISLTNIATIYFLKRQYKLAAEYDWEAARLAHGIGAVRREYEAHLGLSATYRAWAAATSDTKTKSEYLLNSIEHHEQFVDLRDKVFNEEKQKDIGKLEARHEYEMATLKREREEKEKAEIAAEERSRRNNLQYSASLLAICLLFGGLFFMGKLTLPKWAVELSVFLPFLILFEFLLVLTDPYVNSWTEGEPAFNLLVNASFAGLIFPLHSFFERLLKERLFKPGLPNSIETALPVADV